MTVAAAPARRTGTILLVDPDDAFRAEARSALAATGYAVEEVHSGEEAVERTSSTDVVAVVVDVRLPGISGYEVCRRLRERHGDRVAVVFVSSDRVEPSDRVAGLLVGADDYLAKPVAVDELTARVHRLCATRAPRPAMIEHLTARERQVLALLAEGLGPVEIGRRLLISPKTVGTHAEHIYAKLGVHSRAQAVAKAFRLSLVDAS